MNTTRFLNTESEIQEIWQARWEESQSTFNPNELLCLQPTWIEQTCRELEWQDEVRLALLGGLDLFHKHPKLQQLLWHCRHLLFVKPATDATAQLRSWPMLSPKLHPAAELFYAYLFMAGLPFARAQHQQWDVSPDITRDTFSDLPLWLNDYRQKHGRWGLNELQHTGWLYEHLTGKIFRIGRLQYRFETFQYAFRVYRELDGAQTVIMAEHNQNMRSDGRYASADGKLAHADTWATSFEATTTAITGHPVDTRGLVQHAQVTLPTHTWRLALAPGDKTLGVHIPAGAPLTPALCQASFRAATAFFSQKFPDCAAKVFTCASWLLDAQFSNYMRADSNILRFQRYFKLFPVPNANARQTLERVFGRADITPEQMPRETSLQRIIAEHMITGGSWYLTGGLLVMADVLPRSALERSEFEI